MILFDVRVLSWRFAYFSSFPIVSDGFQVTWFVVEDFMSLRTLDFGTRRLCYEFSRRGSLTFHDFRWFPIVYVMQVEFCRIHGILRIQDSWIMLMLSESLVGR